MVNFFQDKTIPQNPLESAKFKSNAHLVLPYSGPQSGKGRPKIKGDRVDLAQLPATVLVESIQDTATKISTHVY